MVIGREGGGATLETVKTNDLVSRTHAKVSYDERSKVWILEDLGSGRGTFVDGTKVTKQRLTGQVTAWLGSSTTGERIDFEAPGTHRRRFSTRVLVGAAAAAVVLIVAGVLFVTRGGSEPAPAAGGAGNDVARMQEATGLVIALGDTDAKASSTVLCGDNLVLTNAHVAQSDAPGQGLLYGSAEVAPEKLYLAYPPADNPDGLAEVKFKAEVVAYDGYADVAVLRIVSEASGTAPDAIVDGAGIADPSALKLSCAGLPPVGPLPSKTPIDVFGYPGVSASDDESKFFQVQIDSDSNELTSYAEDTLLFGTGERDGWINLGRDIQHGNSGGLVAHNNQIVGIPTQTDPTGEQSRARPIDVARPAIEAARKGQSGDLNTYLTPLTGHEDVTFTVADVAPDGCLRMTVADSDSKGKWMVAKWTGIAADAHAKAIASYNGSGYSRVLGRSQEGPSSLGQADCLAVGPIAEDKRFGMQVLVGPNYEKIFAPS